MRIALSLLLIEGCVQGASFPDVAPVVCTHGVEVVLVGDSITWMPGYSDAVERAYPFRQVVTVGFPDRSTVDCLPGAAGYRHAAIALRQPRVVGLLIGSNDATEPMATSRQWYWENLDWIVATMLDEGAGRVVVMTPPRFSFFFAPFTVEAHERLSEYAEEIADLCGVEGDLIDCGPNLRELLGAEDLLDGLHPNATGHAKIAAALLPILASAPTDGCVATAP